MQSNHVEATRQLNEFCTNDQERHDGIAALTDFENTVAEFGVHSGKFFRHIARSLVIEPSARICRIVKGVRAPKDKFGFTYKAIKIEALKDLEMEVVTNVVAGSPACLAGLRNEDRIFSINGVNIIGKTHEETVKAVCIAG